MKTKSYEGKTTDEIREMLKSGEMSRSTHYRIRRETGVVADEEKRNSSAYEVSKGKWV